MTDTSTIQVVGPVTDTTSTATVSASAVPSLTLTVPLGNFYTSVNAPADQSSVQLTGYAVFTSGMVETPITATINGSVLQFASSITASDPSTGTQTVVPIIGVKLPDGTRKIGKPSTDTLSNSARADAVARVAQKKLVFAQTRTAALARANLRKAAGTLPQAAADEVILTASQLTSTPDSGNAAITDITGAVVSPTETETPYSVSSQMVQDQSTVAASEMVTKEYFKVF